MMTVTPETLTLIKKYEGFRPLAYLCPAGKWTIGYGTRFIDGKPVRQGMQITEVQARLILEHQVANFQQEVLQLVKVPLNPHQLTALVSFAYNIGIQAFKDSTLLRKLNAKDYDGAAHQFPRWCHGEHGEVLKGLLTRRQEEEHDFETR